MMRQNGSGMRLAKNHEKVCQLIKKEHASKNVDAVVSHSKLHLGVYARSVDRPFPNVIPVMQ
jgi:hypothetical protein